jgi:hypothetical protein
MAQLHNMDLTSWNRGWHSTCELLVPKIEVILFLDLKTLKQGQVFWRQDFGFRIEQGQVWKEIGKSSRRNRKLWHPLLCINSGWKSIYMYLLMLNEHARGCAEDTPLQSQSPGWAVSTIPCRTRACRRWSQAVEPIPFCNITFQALFSCCQDVIVCCDSLSKCTTILVKLYWFWST